MLKVRAAAAPALVTVLALALSACGGTDKKEPVAEQATSATPADSVFTAGPTPYLPAPPAVTLTEPGTTLALGEPAVVAYAPRQGSLAVLEVTVARIERTTFQQSFEGWQVDDVTSARTPYFVRFVATNAGDTDLGDLTLDNFLWADDGTTLEASNYYSAEQLAVCPGGPLPTPFPNGSTVEMCATYFLAPARTLAAVTFQPPEGLAAVSWQGELSKVGRPGKLVKKDKKDKKDEKDDAQDMENEPDASGSAEPTQDDESEPGQEAS